jgi:hypothetical protein
MSGLSHSLMVIRHLLIVGEIDVAELRTTMHELGDLLTEEEIQAFMAIMDSDNDGIIGVSDAIICNMDLAGQIDAQQLVVLPLHTTIAHVG